MTFLTTYDKRSPPITFCHIRISTRYKKGRDNKRMIIPTRYINSCCAIFWTSNYLSIHLSIYLSIHLTIISSIHPCILLSTHHTIHSGSNPHIQHLRSKWLFRKLKLIQVQFQVFKSLLKINPSWASPSSCSYFKYFKKLLVSLWNHLYM